MADEKIEQAIKNGEVALGVEFGSTTVKAILTTEDFKTIASGSYEWDNSLQDGLWTAQKSINWTIFIQLIRRHLRYDRDYKN